MFKRKPRSYSQMATEMVYPRGGWKRAAQYVIYRIRRLPDQPHRIGRGFGAGVFISFTPFFGAHFLGAAVIAWLIRGNILAALLGTFIGNPLTTPLIAVTSVGLGRWILGVHGTMRPSAILHEFTAAGGQLWQNILAVFTSASTRWDAMAVFYDNIFLPYLVGGLVPGLVAGIVAHYMTVPVIRAYHNRRAHKMEKRIAHLRDLTSRRRPTAPPPPDGDA